MKKFVESQKINIRVDFYNVQQMCPIILSFQSSLSNKDTDEFLCAAII